jgi:GNAT superfamily N-acetyltransferase
MSRRAPSTAPAFERLAWDSRFFGAQIARLESKLADPVDLGEAVAEAAREGIDCLYLDFEPGPGASVLPERFGFHLMDVQVTLTRSATAGHTVHTDRRPAVRQASVADLPTLSEVAAALAPWSRFAADPNFGLDAACRMYAEWLRRAAASDEELLAIAELGGDSIGLVTVESDPLPRIGLLVAARPGVGAGSALVLAAITWAAERGDTVEVRTQARNVGALRLYERHGFGATRVRYLYHCWLRETAP